MSMMDDLEAEQRAVEIRSQKAAGATHPSGWRPGYEWDGSTGELTTPPLESEPDDWDALAAELGVPSFLTVDQNAQIRFSSWDGWTKDGEGTVPARLTSFKVTLRRKGHTSEFDYPELAKVIRSRKKPKKAPPSGGDQWLIVPVADLQTGKRAGGGLRGLAERMKRVEANLVDQVKNLRRIGVELEGIAFVGMGDIVENCSGFFSSMQSETNVGLRDQMNAAKDMIWSLIDTAAPMFEKVTVSAVAGNHGENRGRGPGSITNPRQDNFDLVVFEWLGDKMWQVPKYEHVQFRIPDDQLATSMDFGGVAVGFTHGHQFDRGGGLPIQKAINYVKGQALGGTSAWASCDVYVWAHYHHPIVMEVSSGKWFVQCPTIDGGSKYFEQATGMSSSPGMASFVVGGGVPFDHWRIL